MRKLFFLFLTLVATTSLWAYDFKSGDLYYNITSSSAPYTVEVSGVSSITSAVIPSTVTYNGTTFSVTSIGDEAFSYCSYLTSVTIPNSVTSIGDWAFYFCESLTSITIPNSVTSIGSYAFEGCSKLTKTNYTGDIASWCNIKFGSYSANPMYYSHNFYINDQEIKDLVIPNSVTSIGGSAFYNCSSLTSVTIPNSVTSIGNYAFEGCSKLTKTNYTGDIAGWCNIKFGSYSANPMYYSHNFYINDQEIKDLVIPNSVTSIGDGTFGHCSSLTSVTIPNSVTSIGDGAFFWCSSLTSVTIPNSVTSIGGSAFSGCFSLTSVTIGESVTSIGSWAFANCSSLSTITIPNSVTSIERHTFEGCSALTSVTIGNSVTSIGSGAFNDCSSLTSITCEAETPPTIGYASTFYDVSTSIPVYVPCGCVEAYKAASGWSDFTNIQGPLAEYSIEVYVNDTIMGTAKVNYNTFCEGNQISAKPNFGYHFVQWSDGNTDAIRTLELTQDTILTAEFAQPFSGQCGDDLYWSYDETAKTISITGSGKMYDYTATTQPWLLFKEEIKEVIIANTATSIGTSAFEGCIRLGKVSIGTAMVNIGANAFAGCTRLYHIYCYPTYPPFADESSFANYNVYLHVPCNNKEEYDLDIVWGKFKFIECLGAESEPVAPDTVIVTPGSTDVTITWPTEDGADTYTIVIKKDGEVVCTLTFNAEGQLINIAFAPGRNGNHSAQYAEAVANGGYRFTVTGLEEGTHYTYNIDVKNTANQTINSHTGAFTTQSTTAVDNITTTTANIQKIMRNGQLIILRDGVEYNAMGQEL